MLPLRSTASAETAARSALVRPCAVLALLALGAVASAQAQSAVSLYGMVDMSVGQAQAPGAASTKVVDSGRMSTSYWGVKGSEDLGGGLSAVFTLESFMLNDTGAAGRFTGDAYFARNSFVGLSSSSLGSVKLGRNTTSLFVNTLVFNAFGDSFGFSPAIRHYFISGTVSGDTGWNNSVMYATPSFGGLSATATIAAGEANGGRNSAVSAMYFGGPVGLGFAWQKAKMGALVDDTTSWQLGGSFNFSPVKLYAQYGKVDNDTTGNSFKITGLGGDYALTSAGKLMLQWGKVKPDVGAGRTTTTFGYDHQVSKRTDLYAVYMSDRQTGKTSGTAYAVGMRHRF